MNTATNMTDGELLQQYAGERSETAFAELVQRHLNLVYSAALRQMENTHQAEDIAQSVFTDLARKAAKLVHHSSLAGWLFTSVRLAAGTARRTQQRRATREREAMNAMINSTESDPDWTQIRPFLDQTLCELDHADREAVLLRHFEDRSFVEIGQRLGLSENAARMRVARALEKLHAELARRGVTSTGAALAIALAANAVVAAPPALMRRVTSASVAAGSSGVGLSALLARLLFSKASAIAAIVLCGIIFTIIASKRHGHPIMAAAFEATPRTGNATTLQSNVAGVPEQSNSAIPAAVARVRWTNGAKLHLKIVTADSGQPIPMVQLDSRGWRSEKFFGDHFVSDRWGGCDVVYPTNTTELELTTRKDAFADTQLLWRPAKGDVIPTNYLLRVDRAATIGGRVVGPDGEPVAGATIGWNHQDNPTTLTLPQNHRFGWVTATTDAEGHWTLTRIADDMILDIYGSASHSNYVGSRLVFGHDKKMESELRSGIALFKLGRAITAQGIVVDESGAPLAGAQVLVGRASYSGSRKGKTFSNGSFSIPGCEPSERLVTARMRGYGATTVEADLAAGQPVRLVLKAGRTLRLHVTDTLGNPIAGAWVGYDSMGPITDLMHGPPRPISPQADFNKYTDRKGTVVWDAAPIGRLTFNVTARGHFRASTTVDAKATNQTIVLSPALVVHGMVTDAATGAAIPKFRIGEGWPEWNPINGATNPMWSTIGRFWSDFSGGVYSNSLEEAVMSGEENKGYFLKFVATGYAPFVSRVIGPAEGNVELNVALQPSVSVAVTVIGPDGNPARGVDVGLVSPGARLNLQPGGFSWANIQVPGSLLKTDAHGQFTLVPDIAVQRVIAASPEGYAEATPAELLDNPALHLQPWGALQVVCQSGGKPVAGAEYRVDLKEGSLETVSFRLFDSQKSDDKGQIVFSQVPPGRQQLIRVHSERMGNGRQMMNGPAQPVEIQAGGTTTLTVEDQPFNPFNPQAARPAAPF